MFLHLSKQRINLCAAACGDVWEFEGSGRKKYPLGVQTASWGICERI